ncbi:uncharacterized protein LOC126594332 [Malus sylvestris]|uniref:uncharacterized protein LOC126594332 n=1 Tax=Malus sylvestris TaxID=3752 RepID=UPI0021ABE679|nr:uncharacterized protein LOC126594332 [Malus sylvestris]
MTSMQRGKRVKRVRVVLPLHPPSLPSPLPPPPPPPPTPSLPPHAPSPEEPTYMNLEIDFDFIAKKMTHGKSCGKCLHNILEANGGKKIPVIFDFKLQVPNDLVVSGFFTTKIGNIVRTHSPVCYDKWMKVSPQEKRTQRDKLLVLFVVDLSHTKIIKYVDKKMVKLYSVFRHRLYKYYLSCGTPAKGQAKLLNDQIWNGKLKSHWDWLCDNVYATTHFLICILSNLF